MTTVVAATTRSEYVVGFIVFYCIQFTYGSATGLRGGMIGELPCLLGLRVKEPLLSGKMSEEIVIVSAVQEQFAATSKTWRQTAYTPCPVCHMMNQAHQMWVLQEGRVTLTPHGSGVCGRCGTKMRVFTGAVLRTAAHEITDAAGYIVPENQQRAALELSLAPRAGAGLTVAALRESDPDLALALEASSLLWAHRTGFAAAGILTACGGTLEAHIVKGLMASAQDVLLPVVDKRTKT